MTLAPIRLLRSTLFATILSLVAATVAHAEPAAPTPTPKLRLKNAQSIRVTLGTKRHEPASAIRPEKGVWNLLPAADLAGASAELVDLTPNAPRSRWVVDVQGDKLVLDARRFLPTHVYQLDVHKDKKVVGSVLVYLYPPPDEKVGKVEFKDEETRKDAKDKGEKDDLAAVPKGDL